MFGAIPVRPLAFAQPDVVPDPPPARVHLMGRAWGKVCIKLPSRSGSSVTLSAVHELPLRWIILVKPRSNLDAGEWVSGLGVGGQLLGNP
jgi:hypothetical protein